MSVTLKETAGGILLPIHAQPGARRNGVVGLHDGRLKIAVTQVAEKGKANHEILKVLVQALGLSKSQVSLEAGTTSSRKVVRITGITAAELQRKLDGVLS